VLAAVATLEFLVVALQLRLVAAVWVLAVKVPAAGDQRVVEVLRLLAVCLEELTAALLLLVVSTSNQQRVYLAQGRV
jgi:hypothetical protein